MARTVEITGGLAIILPVLIVIFGSLLVLGVALYPFDSLTDVSLMVVAVGIVGAVAVRMWRVQASEHPIESASPGTIHNSLAPGRMAKDRWRNAVNRLPGNDDDDDGEDDKGW